MMRPQHRWLRVAWAWCLLYTSLVPEPAGSRRRFQVLGHLWESERAGLTALPVSALPLSSFADAATAGRTERIALYGSLFLLAVSGLLAVRRRS